MPPFTRLALALIILVFGSALVPGSAINTLVPASVAQPDLLPATPGLPPTALSPDEASSLVQKPPGKPRRDYVIRDEMGYDATDAKANLEYKQIQVCDTLHISSRNMRN